MFKLLEERSILVLKSFLLVLLSQVLNSFLCDGVGKQLMAEPIAVPQGVFANLLVFRVRYW